MLRLLAIPLAALAVGTSIQPLPGPLQTELSGRYWHARCPVQMSQLRLLTVTHWGFDGATHTGQLIVNRDAAAPLARVFQKLYELRFPIRHLRLDDAYGPRRSQPADGDISGSFECRQAVPSPCPGGSGTGHWSNHAYGLAVDLNPVENPYLSWNTVLPARGRQFLDRAPGAGVITAGDQVVAAFGSIGWIWGGTWSGPIDYQHFSASGR